VAILLGPTAGKPEPYTARRKRKLDSLRGRERIIRRCATVEPVFGNLHHNKRLHRFTRRGRTKVEGQWRLYWLIHNIGKMGRLG